MKNEGYLDNASLDAAYMLFINEADLDERTKAFGVFLNVLAKKMSEGAMVPTPFMDADNALSKYLNFDDIKAGSTFVLDMDVRLKMDTMTGSDGSLWIPLFINDREISRGETANITAPVPIFDILNIGLEREDVKGVVINPFGKPFTMGKDFLNQYLSDYEEWSKRRKSDLATTEGGNR